LKDKEIDEDSPEITAEMFSEAVVPQQSKSVERHRKWQATLDQEVFFNQVFGSHNNDNRPIR